MIWSGVETAAVAVVSLVISIVLARMLSTRAFGLVAVIQVFLAAGQMFAEAGVSQALIRLPRRTASLESAALWLNTGLSLLFYTGLWCSAPFISDFYDSAELTDVIRLSGLSIPLAAVCVVQNARLATDMRFDKLAAVSVISVCTGGLAGIIAARHHAGVLALICQQLVTWGCRVLLFWCMSPWRPTFRLKRQEVIVLTRFSWKLLASGIIDTIYVNMYAPLVGHFFSISLTALYWRADSLARYVPQGFSNIIQRVTVPAISRIRTQSQRTRATYMRIIGCASWIIFPVAAICIGIAEPLFEWMLTDKWAGAVPYFRILFISLSLYPLHALNCSALNIFGRSDKFLILEVIKKVIGVTVLLITLPFGVEALCCGILGCSILTLGLNIGFASRYTGLTVKEQAHLIWPYTATAATAGLAAYGVTCILTAPWLQSIGGAITGGIIYLIQTRIFHFSAPTDIRAIFSKEQVRESV